MLEQKHFKRFVAMMHGNLQVAELTADEAVAFAGALAECSSEPLPPTEKSREYLRRWLDHIDKGLNAPKVSNDELAFDTFMGEDGFESQLKKGSTKAHIPDNWKSIATLEKEYIGDFRDIKKRVLASHEGAPAQAESIKVAGRSIHISPEYEKWLIENNILETNEMKKNWKPINALVNENVGGIKQISPLLHVQYEGAPPRMKSIRCVGRNTFISLEYEAWLKEQGILRPLELAADAAPAGWQSAKGLRDSNQFVGGNEKMNRVFEAFREEQVACLQAAGMQHDLAKKWVQENWIGSYRGKKGNDALFVSPEALEAIINDGLLQRREDSAEEAKPRSISASRLRLTNKFKGHESALQSKLWGADKENYDPDSIFGKLVGDIQAALKITENEALQLAYDHLAAYEKPKTGPQTTRFTMDLVRAAVLDGTLKRKDGLEDIPDEEMRLLPVARKKAKDSSRGLPE